jgi:putative glutamine amidotransferase
MKPVVAVTMWRRTAPTYLYDETPLHTLVDDYARAIDRAGAVAMMLGRLDPDDVDEVLDLVHGLVVTGGGDIDPSAYGHRNRGSADIEPDADRRDLALIRAAHERGMPVLGICRGHQAINVALGGALRQHVLGEHAAHPERAGTAVERNDHRHVVVFEPGCRLAAIYGTEERKVNSLHHQAVIEVGDGLAVTARTPDGAIEAVESTDPGWPVLAVQWHPEMLGEDPAEDSLFAAFVNDALAYRRTR